MNTTASIGQKITGAVERASEALRELSLKIHANPETAFHEVKAKGWISEFLASQGFEVSTPWGSLETAFKATRKGKASGPTVAFVAEYDALPRIGHACGHNLYAICAVGASVGMAAEIGDLDGTIALIGTPAEENGNGKIVMLQHNAFAGIDYALMAHAGVKNMICRPTMAGVTMEVEFRGVKSHSKESWKGKNALQAVLELFRGIDGFRASSPHLSHINGIITEGGDSTSTITDYAAARFSIQGRTKAHLDLLIERMKVAVKAAELLTGTNGAVRYDEIPMLNRIPNRVMADRFRERMAELGVAFEYAPPFEPMGLSDAGNLSHVLPIIHPYFKIAEPHVSSHSEEFERAAGSDEAMASALRVAKGLALVACDILTDSQLREKIDEQFRNDIRQDEERAVC